MQPIGHQKGHAVLEVDCIFNESTVTGAYATSPIKLLTPRSRGRCVCGYAGNFGGGLVAGDQTRLDLRVGKGTRCFLGTQASTKIYRNPQSLPCSHTTRAAVGADGLLVFAPAPVQPFAESSYEQRQEFRLDRGAALALLDWYTSGRAACGERWAFQHLLMRNEVWQCSAPDGLAEPSTTPNARLTDGARKDDTKATADVGSSGNDRAQASKAPPDIGRSPTTSNERCVFLDSCCLNSQNGDLAGAHRTGRFNCFAMLVLIGAPLKELTERMLEHIRGLAVKRRSPLLVSASPIHDGAVLRLAGEQFGAVDGFLRKHLSPLANLLGEDPWSRRW